MRSTRTPRWTSLLLLLPLAAASLLAASGSEGARSRADAAAAAGWRGLVGEDRARVALGNRAIVLLKAPSLADRLAQAGGQATEAEMRGWTAAALAAQKQLAAKLAGKGLPLVPELTFTRVVNGSAPNEMLVTVTASQDDADSSEFLDRLVAGAPRRDLAPSAS